jgi:hypothetical protein
VIGSPVLPSTRTLLPSGLRSTVTSVRGARQVTVLSLCLTTATATALREAFTCSSYDWLQPRAAGVKITVRVRSSRPRMALLMAGRVAART